MSHRDVLPEKTDRPLDARSAAQGGAPMGSGALPLFPDSTTLGNRFAAHLRDSGLIRPGQSVLVALSGGVDSTVLLHLLIRLRDSWSLRIGAAHFDHRMRPDSGADAEWVRGLCRAWRVPLEHGFAEVPPVGEAEARDLRYRFLHAAADRFAADRLATAHHADDQAETVLFRIARGTGLDGLAGIPARRGEIVRPLLPFWRKEIQEYAEYAGLRYRIDPTNRSLSPARNRIRLEVIPALEKVAPGAAQALTRLGEQAREDAEAWEWVLDGILPQVILSVNEDTVELARPSLLSYHPRIRSRILRRMLRELGSHPDRTGTRAVVEFITFGASGAYIQVAGNIRVEREFDRIRIRKTAPSVVPVEPDRPLVIPGPGDGAGIAVIGGRRIRVRWSMEASESGAESESFDPTALRFPLEVRGRRPGDRIELAYGTKKLKKLLAELRVGLADRALVPVVADAEGRVLWVVGIARTARAVPEPGRPLFQITVIDAEPSS